MQSNEHNVSSIIQLQSMKSTPSPSSAPSALITARRVLEIEARALEKLSASLNDGFVRAVDMIHQAEGRVIVTGIGKSGHVGRKIAATLASTGTPAFFVHPSEASHGDMGMIVRGDVVLALSNSGESRELGDITQYTRRCAIPLIAMTARIDSTLGSRADVVLLLPNAAEACPNGLAPTTSTTMAMALGDALAIALLERKGFSAQDYKVIHPGGKLGQQLMQVCDIMHTGDRMPCASEDTPMADVVRIMTEKGMGCIALTDATGKLAGVITDGDLRRHLASDPLSKKPGDIMSRTPKTARDDMLVAEAVAVMNDLKNVFRKITCLIIVDAGQKPVGILHIHDCLRAGFA